MFKLIDPDIDPGAKVRYWLLSDDIRGGGEWPEETFFGLSEMGDRETENLNLPRYQEFMAGNPAYKWLLAKFESGPLLSSAHPNHMQPISNAIEKVVSHRAFQVFSRKRSPHVCDMTFTVDWDPIRFLQEQEYDEPYEQALECAITITGTGRNAQILTTVQYLRQTWPLAGEEVFQVQKRVVRAGYATVGSGKCQRLLTNDPPLMCVLVGRMYDHTTVKMFWDGQMLSINAVGTLDSVAEIAEIIAWLGSALRSSPQERGVVYCHPILSNVMIKRRQEDKTTAKCNVHFKIEVDNQDTVSTDRGGTCWHELFRNPVSVKGFPIRKKPQNDMGAEIPIEIMAGLLGSNQVSRFAKDLFIKAFSEMVVLVKQIGDVFVWHLLLNENGDHISYCDSRFFPSGLASSMHDLTVDTTRHVVGWCSSVRNFAGKS